MALHGAVGAIGDGSEARPPATTSPATGGFVVWLTGLSGAGKTTLADGLAAVLRAEGVPTLQLDGDELRKGINADLGFGEADRSENVRRTAAIAALAASQGFAVVCSLISPLRKHREQARAGAATAFLEVYVKCDVEICIQRDPKRLYARALKGEVADFTGVSASYEEPDAPDLVVDTGALAPDQALARLVERVRPPLARPA